MNETKLLTREDILQALSNKDLKVALPKEFLLYQYSSSFFDRIKLVIKNRGLKWFHLRTMKIESQDEGMAILFGVEKDFETETDNKLYNGMILQLNEDMFRYIVYKDTKDKLYKEMAKYFNREE